jgi:hypothetical protein
MPEEDGAMEMTDHDFLTGLQLFGNFEHVADQTVYRALPPGWALAVADIVASTAAIEVGRYKAVNMAGAAVISGLTNSLGHPDLPFVFGGDGAAVAVPPQGLEIARDTLAKVQRWALDDLDLQMRVALVPIEDIREAGFDIRIARFQASPDVSYAMFSGGGNRWADARLKEGLYSVPKAEAGARPDLTGLSCRWNPIKASHGKIVSIIAVLGRAQDEEAFSKLVVEIIELVEADRREGHPIPEDGPKLGYVGEAIGLEARAGAAYRDRMGVLARRLRVMLEVGLVNLLGIVGITLGGFSAALYRKTVASNTDFRKFDDGLKMTIDLDQKRLDALRDMLVRAHAAGICNYGLHEQEAALMTCIVPTPRSMDHMHFVDGAMGGYAAAATGLKRQLESELAA